MKGTVPVAEKVDGDGRRQIELCDRHAQVVLARERAGGLDIQDRRDKALTSVRHQPNSGAQGCPPTDPAATIYRPCRKESNPPSPLHSKPFLKFSSEADQGSSGGFREALPSE